MTTPLQGLERRRRVRGWGSGRQSAIRSRITMVSSRSGPTPIAEIRHPDIFSNASTYARALAGRSPRVRAPVMSSVQPGKFSYTGWAWWKSDWVMGISSKR